nr:retrovirus-related Pol polyprotein from transposon TNT 1-94 [Tanacetum cinerariifolium]
SSDSSEAVPQHEENETTESQAQTTRTLNRERKRPAWHLNYVIERNVAYCLLTKEGETSTLQEALNNSDSMFWNAAMQEEIEALHKNKTWELMPLPRRRKSIRYKWVYKIKINGDELVERYHARLMVKGYAPKEGIDFNENFPPVKIKCLRTDNGGEYAGDEFDTFCRQDEIKRQFTIAYTPQQNGVTERMNKTLLERARAIIVEDTDEDPDEKAAMQEEIKALHKNKTWELMPLPRRRKSIRYKWVYKIKRNDDELVERYHARLMVKGPNKDCISNLKAKLAREYEMKDLGPANKILGKQIHRDKVILTEINQPPAAQASKEAVWLKMLLEELRHKQKKITPFCDNQSALYLARNPAFHSKTKHIRVRLSNESNHW